MTADYLDYFHTETLQPWGIAPASQHPEQAQQPAMALSDVQDQVGQTVRMGWPGSCAYVDFPSVTSSAALSEVQKKREHAEDSPNFSQYPAKPRASASLHAGAQSDLDPFPGPGMQLCESDGWYPAPSTYERGISHQRPYIPTFTQAMSHAYSGGSTIAGNMKGASPSSGGYGIYPTATPQDSSSKSSVGSKVVRLRKEKSSASSSNPPLVRTSILRPQTSSTSRTPGFNLYTIYPSAKAKLELQGDLLTMAGVRNWTNEEKKSKRRLVEFQRRQDGSIIHASFNVVRVYEETPGASCVSCIFWEEREECFVTSVDIIQLLEGLVGVRFTKEEKNRIRRNLEGFKPLTVSKQKEDSESFFRLIMGYPEPKPRNIEKDVKVFPWSILSNTLRKIIDKYSASYASTSAILTP